MISRHSLVKTQHFSFFNVFFCDKFNKQATFLNAEVHKIHEGKKVKYFYIQSQKLSEHLNSRCL
jgi:hypothetical protein